MLPLSSFLFLYLKKWYYLFATALIYLTLLMTLTRSAWLGSLVAFVLLIVLTKNKFTDKKSIIMLATTFFMVSVVFEIISGGDLILRFTAIGKDLGAMAVQSDDYATKSGLYRVFIAEHVIELIKERPLFGWGPDTLGLVFTDRYADKIISELGTLMIFDKAHNEYLQIAYASGIPALLVYLSLVFTVIKTSFKNLNNNPLMIPLLCGVIGYLVQAFFNISVVSVAYIYWIFLGALMHMATNEENNKVNI
jgi:putative inorganic carbon (HCO3(-)) transporter